MNDTITLRGTVGTDPRQIQTATGLDITSFRLASTQRRYDRDKQEWIDGDTNWYGVSTYRHLARNAANSLKKGDPIIVTGRIKVRPWEVGDKKGLSIEIDADSVGHDLLWGTATYTRSLRRTDIANAPASGSETEPGEGEGPTGDTHGADAATDAPGAENVSADTATVPTPF